VKVTYTPISGEWKGVDAMRICYLGPAERQALLQKWASPGVTVEAWQRGDKSALESVYDEYMEVPAQLQAIAEAEASGFDAVIIGCFGDPGVEAAREIASIPIIGLGETSLTIASMLGTSFGVLTPLRRLLPSTVKQIRSLGLDRKLAHIEPVEISIQVIREDPEGTYRGMLAGARTCYDAGADSLALACGSMSVYAERLQSELEIPVINGLKVSLHFAELMVGSSLSFSKRAYPLPDGLGCNV
jgi:allantoin racemase